MYTCTHCKNKLKNKPLIGSNNKKYCSIRCIPDSLIDEAYSSEYFNLIESINDIESRISDIKDIDDRFELENEVNDLSTSYIADMFGDDEGLFYKGQIYTELKGLDKLYDKIHNIFMERKLQLRRAVIIYWDDLLSIVGNEIYSIILKYFHEKMKSVSCENLHYSCIYSKNSTELGCSIDKLYVKTLRQAHAIKKFYYESFNQYKSKLTDKQLDSLSITNNCIDIQTLAYCFICKEWEPWDDFSFDGKLNVYKCGVWSDCSKYDDYYND